MRLPNEWASKITDKNPDIANRAAEHIINNKDMDAWSCLADHEDRLFDFIKDKISQKIIDAVNEDNVNNLFVLMQRYNDWLSDAIALAAIKFDSLEIHDRMLELLINGDLDQQATAARYFAYIKFDPATTVLIKHLESNNETLKLNAAEALGSQESQKAYDLLVSKLDVDDDWQKVETAELLSAFNNPDALKPILKAMINSGMKENLAAEAASLVCLADYFEDNDEELKTLSLEAIDSIISGIPEILPLANLVAYRFYECIDSLLKLAEGEYSPLSGKYAQILLKAKNKFELLEGNDQYIFDETKETKEEIKHIKNILNLRDETFWGEMTYLLIDELDSQDFYGKLNAITTVGEIGLKFAGEKLINIIKNETTSEMILCQAVYTIQDIEYTEALPDLKKLLIRVQDPNRSAIIDNAIQSLENIKKKTSTKEK